MNLDEFKNLDPNNIGNWPMAAKGVVIAILCALALGAGYYFDTQHQLTELESVTREEADLRQQFKTKQWKAATLPKLEQQLQEIENSLTELQRRLPSKAEVAGLIQDISQAAIASGLKSELFEPEREKREQVYVTLPIKLQLSGDYHAFGQFVSSVAAMPRIVTQHNVNIKSARGGRGESNRLVMEMTAQIYRYLEEGEGDEEAS